MAMTCLRSRNGSRTEDSLANRPTSAARDDRPERPRQPHLAHDRRPDDGRLLSGHWAVGEGDNLRLPLFIDGLTDGTPFGMQQLVTDYTGPGTYGLDKLSGEGSSFTLVAGDGRYVASPDGGATASLKIEADGSGSLTVKQFQIDSGSGTYSSPIDAEVTWTCDDPS